MELTKEYFDKKVKHLATKEDLKVLKKDMQTYTKDEVAHLATMVKDGFGEVTEMLDVKDRVTLLERNYGKISKALFLN